MTVSLKNIISEYKQDTNKEHVVYGVLIDSPQHRTKFLDSDAYVECPNINPSNSQLVLLKLVFMPDGNVFGYTFIPSHGNYDVCLRRIFKREV